jgi:excisionase family DNA binding protein
VEDQTRSLSEVAGLMGVSERTVRRWIKSGRLKAYKPGRDYRIPEAALWEFIEESEVSPRVHMPPSSEPTFNDVLEEEERREDLDKLRELLAKAGASTTHLALPDIEFESLWEGKSAKQRARINQELLEERQLAKPLLVRWASLPPGSGERKQLHRLWLQVYLVRLLSIAVEKNQEAAQTEADAARRAGDEPLAREVEEEAQKFLAAVA